MKEEYDLFISYSHADKLFVREWLLPRLEGKKLQICVDYRDFDIGVPSLVNMEQAIERSRRTIVVLTPNWAQSQWAEFEALLVSTADPAGRRQKLLPLMLESCPVPPRIAMLTYADFRESSEREEALRQLIGQLYTKSAKKHGQVGDENASSRFMFDEAHGQKKWRHLPPTADLGYSEACNSLLSYGSVVTNEGRPLTEATLQECDLFVMPMPFDTLVENPEYEALVHWVSRGGRLLICGFYFMEAHLYTNFSSLGKRLQLDFGRNLIMPRGRTARDDALGQAFPVRNDLCAFVDPQSVERQHSIMAEVDKIALQSSCSVNSCAPKANCELELQTGSNVSIMSPKRGEYSDLIEGKFDIVYEYDIKDSVPATFLVAQTFEKGRVVATGSWRIFIDDYMKDSTVSNLQLFRNSILWLLGGS